MGLYTLSVKENVIITVIIKLKIVVLYKRFVTKKGWSHFRDQPLVGSCYTIFLLFFITNPKPAKPASMIPRK